MKTFKIGSEFPATLFTRNHLFLTLGLNPVYKLYRFMGFPLNTDSMLKELNNLLSENGGGFRDKCNLCSGRHLKCLLSSTCIRLPSVEFRWAQKRVKVSFLQGIKGNRMVSHSTLPLLHRPSSTQSWNLGIGRNGTPASVHCLSFDFCA